MRLRAERAGMVAGARKFSISKDSESAPIAKDAWMAASHPPFFWPRTIIAEIVRLR